MQSQAEPRPTLLRQISPCAGIAAAAAATTAGPAAVLGVQCVEFDN